MFATLVMLQTLYNLLVHLRSRVDEQDCQIAGNSLELLIPRFHRKMIRSSRVMTSRTNRLNLIDLW